MPEDWEGTRCARTTAWAGSRCSSRKPRGPGERPHARHQRATRPTEDAEAPFVRETAEGAQELQARRDTPPDELGREVGSVLRLPESHGVDVSDIDIERPDDETMIINMGPQHPSTHGVLRLMMELDGETVLRTKPIIGYLHTGMEKTAEELTYQQGATNVTRMDYLSPLTNELVFSLATGSCSASSSRRAPCGSACSWPSSSGCRRTSCGWPPTAWTSGPPP